MDLSIVVVSFQNRGLLEKCLKSATERLAGTGIEYEIWVVDNASTDGTVEWLSAYVGTRPEVHAILNPVNGGFAAANNLALRRCAGEFVLLLNNDALLIDDSLKDGLRFLRENPDAFGCGGLLLNPDLSRGVSYGYFPGIETLRKEILSRRLGALRAVVPAEGEGAHAIDFPCGAFFLARRRHVETIGLLDERFFLYFEETDWALRAWKHGLPIHYRPEVRAVHLGGGSSRRAAPLWVTATFYESWFLYLRKHGGALQSLQLLAWLGPYFLARAALAAVRGRDAREPLRQFAGLLWGMAGRPSARLAKAR